MIAALYEIPNNSRELGGLFDDLFETGDIFQKDPA